MWQSALHIIIYLQKHAHLVVSCSQWQKHNQASFIQLLLVLTLLGSALLTVSQFSPDGKTSQTNYKQQSAVHPLSETFKIVRCLLLSKWKEKKGKVWKVFKISCGFWKLFIPFQCLIFFRFIWHTLMLSKSQRLHCSKGVFGKSRNIDFYICRNTVRESENMKYI